MRGQRTPRHSIGLQRGEDCVTQPRSPVMDSSLPEAYHFEIRLHCATHRRFDALYQVAPVERSGT